MAQVGLVGAQEPKLVLNLRAAARCCQRTATQLAHLLQECDSNRCAQCCDRVMRGRGIDAFYRLCRRCRLHGDSKD